MWGGVFYTDGVVGGCDLIRGMGVGSGMCYGVCDLIRGMGVGWGVCYGVGQEGV